MSKYEVLYVISPALSDEQKDEVINKYKKFVEDNKGTVVGVDKLGQKALAYPIKFQKEGFYVLMTFTSTKEASISLGKNMLINENLLRHIIVNKD